MKSRLLTFLVGLLGLTTLSLPAWAVPVDPNGTFIDDDYSVHEAAIEAIAEAEITRGCNPPINDEYCPQDAITREQMATFLQRALEFDGPPLTPGDDAFVDDDDSLHESAINALAAIDVIRGCNPPDNNEFCPGDPVTRGQMAALLTRAFEFTDDDPDEDRFVDDDDSMFEGDIEALAAAGVTLGCNPPDNDRYCPDDAVTRAQMASFLTRTLGLAPLLPPSVAEADLVRPFFMLDQPEDGPYLAAVARYVDSGIDTPEQAVLALLEGPSDAEQAQTPTFSTEVPFGTTLNDLTIAGGVATVDLSDEYDDGGGSATMLARLGQLSFTLTEFPEIDSVELELDGVPVDVFSSEGIDISDGLDPDFFFGAGVVPEHFPTAPAWHEFVEAPVIVTGYSRAFEATIQWQLLDDTGALITEGFETTGSAGPDFGPMEFDIDVDVDTRQQVTIRIFESSAQDGSPTDIRDTVVWLEP
jgi:hypothetical protein